MSRFSNSVGRGEGQTADKALPQTPVDLNDWTRPCYERPRVLLKTLRPGGRGQGPRRAPALPRRRSEAAPRPSRNGEPSGSGPQRCRGHTQALSQGRHLELTYETRLNPAAHANFGCDVWPCQVPGVLVRVLPRVALGEPRGRANFSLKSDEEDRLYPQGPRVRAPSGPAPRAVLSLPVGQQQL